MDAALRLTKSRLFDVLLIGAIQALSHTLQR